MMMWIVETRFKSQFCPGLTMPWLCPCKHNAKNYFVGGSCGLGRGQNFMCYPRRRQPEWAGESASLLSAKAEIVTRGSRPDTLFYERPAMGPAEKDGSVAVPIPKLASVASCLDKGLIFDLKRLPSLFCETISSVLTAQSKE